MSFIYLSLLVRHVGCRSQDASHHAYRSFAWLSDIACSVAVVAAGQHDDTATIAPNSNNTQPAAASSDAPRSSDRGPLSWMMVVTDR